MNIESLWYYCNKSFKEQVLGKRLLPDTRYHDQNCEYNTFIMADNVTNKKILYLFCLRLLVRETASICLNPSIC